MSLPLRLVPLAGAWLVVLLQACSANRAEGPGGMPRAAPQRKGDVSEQDLMSALVTRWHSCSELQAREAARSTTVEELRDYLSWKMGEDVARQVANELQTIAPGIEPQRVRELWFERKGGSYHTATYGCGTWLLGESGRAELDPTKEKEAEAPKGSQSAARKKLEERIKRYLENQHLVRDSSRNNSDQDAPETFWREWDQDGRSQWAMAYYAEKSGDFRDLQTRFSNCHECGGTGARAMPLAVGGKAGETLVPCPTCHLIGIVRRVRYR